MTGILVRASVGLADINYPSECLFKLIKEDGVSLTDITEDQIEI